MYLSLCRRFSLRLNTQHVHTRTYTIRNTNQPESLTKQRTTCSQIRRAVQWKQNVHKLSLELLVNVIYEHSAKVAPSVLWFLNHLFHQHMSISIEDSVVAWPKPHVYMHIHLHYTYGVNSVPSTTKYKAATENIIINGLPLESVNKLTVPSMIILLLWYDVVKCIHSNMYIHHTFLFCCFHSQIQPYHVIMLIMSP